jgi:hypothetical protein
MTPSRPPPRTVLRHLRGGAARWVVIGLGGVALLLSACSDEAKDQIGEAIEGVETGPGGDTAGGSAPPATDPPATDRPPIDRPETDRPETDPPSTDPPSTDPPGTEAPPASDPPAGGDQQPTTDDAMSTEDWILLGILGVAAFALIVGVTSAAHSHSEKKAAALAEQNRSIGEIVGTSRWIHDQGSLEVLRQTDPGALERSWDDLRGRMVDLEARIATKRSATDDGDLGRSLDRLGQAVAGLRGALTSYVSLSAGAVPGTEPELIQDASRTARERRNQLAAAIDPVAAAQR